MQIDVNGKLHIGDALRTHIERNYAALFGLISATPPAMRIASTRADAMSGAATERTS
ncbi:MAG: hypothetical protein WEC00_06465 [Dongiaceae bacterium]